MNKKKLPWKKNSKIILSFSIVNSEKKWLMYLHYFLFSQQVQTPENQALWVDL